MRTYLLTIALLVVMGNSIHAQTREALEAEREEQARLIAATLIGEGLVVYVPTDTRKIAAMQDLIDNGDLTEANRSRLKERLSSTIAETKAQAKHIQAAFKEYYEIGPVYFLPDTSLVKLNQGQRSGLAYNANLEIDPSITLPNNFVLVRAGYLDPATTTGAEGLILTDSAGRPLVKPFPSGVAFNNLGYLFNSILAKEIADRKRWEAVVKSLNRRFWRALDALGTARK